MEALYENGNASELSAQKENQSEHKIPKYKSPISKVQSEEAQHFHSYSAGW